VNGVQNYIAYPVGRTRRFICSSSSHENHIKLEADFNVPRFGMIVAECFSKILDPVAEKPLEFEYQPLSDSDEDGQSDNGDEMGTGIPNTASNLESPQEPLSREKQRNKARSYFDRWYESPC